MLFKYITTFLLSTVKFAFALPLAAYQYKFSFFETFIICSLGGVTGIILFAFLSKQILNIWEIVVQKTKLKKQKKEKRKFTKRNRFIIKIKSNYGLIGLSIITPILISIPVGTFLTIRYYKNYWKSVTSLILSVLFWAGLISVAIYKF